MAIDKFNPTFENGIVVDDGSVREVIRNKMGQEVGVIIFRPSDIGIIDRYNEVVGDFEKITEPLEHININPDGSANDGDEAAITALRESKEKLFKACNYLFDGDVADAFFGSMHPFSIVNGYFYCENVIDVLGKYISGVFNQETKKLNKRVQRYTHGYRTGKHKNGGKRKGNKK